MQRALRQSAIRAALLVSLFVLAAYTSKYVADWLTARKNHPSSYHEISVADLQKEFRFDHFDVTMYYGSDEVFDYFRRSPKFRRSSQIKIRRWELCIISGRFPLDSERPARQTHALFKSAECSGVSTASPSPQPSP